MHYQRWRHTGTTDPKPPRPAKLCECGKPVRCKGLCRRCYRRACYERNRDHERATFASYYAANGEALRKASERWRKEHPLQRREQASRYQRTRQSRKAGATVTKADYVAILDEFGLQCHICLGAIIGAADLHFDHVIPLSRGGAHSPDNIRPAHSLCNMRKGSKLLSEM